MEFLMLQEPSDPKGTLQHNNQWQSFYSAQNHHLISLMKDYLERGLYLNRKENLVELSH